MPSNRHSNCFDKFQRLHSMSNTCSMFTTLMKQFSSSILYGYLHACRNRWSSCSHWNHCILFDVLNVNPYFNPHFDFLYQSLFSINPKMVHINFPVYANEASTPCLFYVFQNENVYVYQWAWMSASHIKIYTVTYTNKRPTHTPLQQSSRNDFHLWTCSGVSICALRILSGVDFD